MLVAGVGIDFRVYLRFISLLDIRIVLRTPSPQPVRLSEVFQTVHSLGVIGILVFSSRGSVSPAASSWAPSSSMRCGI